MQIYYFSKRKLKRTIIILLFIMIILPIIIYQIIKSKLDIPAFMYSNSYLQNRTIVLDAGHGGIDSGVVHSKGVMEKVINLDIVLHLKEFLERSGARCVLTRDKD